MSKYMVTDANHYGVAFISSDKEKLAKFSELLAEEGGAMSKIRMLPQDINIVKCDIDKEWDGRKNINPFYYWYYGDDDTDEYMLSPDLFPAWTYEDYEEEEEEEEYDDELEQLLYDIYINDLETT